MRSWTTTGWTSPSYRSELAAVYVRCTVPDPNPGRYIADGTVAVGRDGGALASLVPDFELDVDTATDWT